jgi:hypothetical protein
MSSRPQFNPYPVIINGNLSGTIVSAVTIIQKLSLVSYSMSWTGASPVGVISVEVSNDYTQNGQGTVLNPGTWNTLPLSAPTAVTGNSGVGFIDLDANAGFAMRLRYTAVSGSGTINAFVNAKVS